MNIHNDPKLIKGKKGKCAKERQKRIYGNENCNLNQVGISKTHTNANGSDR